MQYPHHQLTEQIIGAAISVHRTLGPGFLEVIYENALKHELSKIGLSARQQQVFPVIYDGVTVGEHRVDLIVEGLILLELKAVERMTPVFVAQTISSLRAANLDIGLLINFNEKVLKDGIKRITVKNNQQSG